MRFRRIRWRSDDATVIAEDVIVEWNPGALWRRRLGAREWKRADLVFVRESDRGGRWEASGERPARDGWQAAVRPALQ